MIKFSHMFGMTFVKGSSYEIDRLKGLAGTELSEGDKVAKLPAFYHVHRNPRKKPILKYIEDKEEREGKNET